MCRRFTLLANNSKLEEQFGVLLAHPTPPLYNVAPTQPILIIKSPDASQPAFCNQPPYTALLVRWGFIPTFTKQPDNWPLTYNIRAETIHIKKHSKMHLTIAVLLFLQAFFLHGKNAKLII